MCQISALIRIWQRRFYAGNIKTKQLMWSADAHLINKILGTMLAMNLVQQIHWKSHIVNFSNYTSRHSLAMTHFLPSIKPQHLSGITTQEHLFLYFCSHAQSIGSEDIRWKFMIWLLTIQLHICQMNNFQSQDFLTDMPNIMEIFVFNCCYGQHISWCYSCKYESLINQWAATTHSLRLICPYQST